MSATPADPLEHEALEARFVDVICGDEELLAAEFEAIISASWRAALPERPDASDLRRPQADRHPRARMTFRPSRYEGAGVPARARQRSPPADR
jgi:hypothetical protein